MVSTFGMGNSRRGPSIIPFPRWATSKAGAHPHGRWPISFQIPPSLPIDLSRHLRGLSQTKGSPYFTNRRSRRHEARHRRQHRLLSSWLPPATMAHGRYPVFPCQLAHIRPTISSIDALNASTRRCLAPTIATYASCPASETPIAPVDSGAHSPAVSFTGGFRTPARPPLCVWRAP